MNLCVLKGRLTQDVNLKYTPNGVPVFNNGIAVDDGYGEKKRTNFFNLVAYKKTAELAGQYLSKGSLVLISGRLQSRNWEAKDGTKRTTIEVVVNNLEFLDKKSDKSETSSVPRTASGTPTASVNYTPLDEVTDEDVPF